MCVCVCVCVCVCEREREREREREILPLCLVFLRLVSTPIDQTSTMFLKRFYKNLTKKSSYFPNRLVTFVFAVNWEDVIRIICQLNQVYLIQN